MSHWYLTFILPLDIDFFILLNLTLSVARLILFATRYVPLVSNLYITT